MTSRIMKVADKLRNSKLGIRAYLLASGLCVGMLGNTQVSAATRAVTADSVSNKIKKFVTFGQGIVVALAALSLLAIGIMFIAGGDESRQKAKKWIKNVAIGVFIAFCAVGLAELLKNYLA